MTRKGIKRLVFGAYTNLLGDQEGYVPIRVLSGLGRGLRLRLNLVGGLETGYLWGNYESAVVNRLVSLVKPGMVVWDCGCYLGYYTCIFARLVGPSGIVVAIEPDETNLNRIKRHVKSNGFENVIYFDAPIGTGDDVEFIISGNTNSHISGSWIGGKREDYRQREIIETKKVLRSVSLDGLLDIPAIPRPDLIKIDIEGFEEVALRYTQKLMDEVAPLIILELHNPDCDKAAWSLAQRWNCELSDIATGKVIDNSNDVGGTVLLKPRSSRRGHGPAEGYEKS